MVGDRNLRIAPEGNSLIAAPEIMTMIWKTAKLVGHDSVFVDGQGTSLTDDHLELQKAGIRAVDVVDFDYPYWHTGERHARQDQRREPGCGGRRGDGTGEGSGEVAGGWKGGRARFR